DDPGLEAVIDQMSPAIRSDEDAARSSDQRAVDTFLADSDMGYDDMGDDADIETAADEPLDVEPNVSAAADAPAPEGVPTPEPMNDRAPDPPVSSHEHAPARGHDPLTEALNDSDAFVRRAAVEAISRRNDPNDTPALLEALRDEDENVRLEAMYALKARLGPD